MFALTLVSSVVLYPNVAYAKHGNQTVRLERNAHPYLEEVIKTLGFSQYGTCSGSNAIKYRRNTPVAYTDVTAVPNEAERTKSLSVQAIDNHCAKGEYCDKPNGHPGFCNKHQRPA